MPLIKIIFLYGLTVPIFFAIDMVWLGVIARSLYRNRLGHLLAETVNWPAAIVFYLLFIAGILIFAVLPALDRSSVGHALLMGALFGFFTYATYDLTNLATLKGWPLMVTLIDLAWGAFLCAAVALLSYLCARWLL